MHYRQAYSVATDERTAVNEIAAQFGTAPDGVLFFCSSAYDLDVLGTEIKRAFACPVTGCTSAGNITSAGFRRGGISALAFVGGAVEFMPFLIRPLDDCERDVMEIANSPMFDERDRRSQFGLLLIDGLSKREEYVASTLYQMLGNIPFIGGSAGDDLAFKKTHVYFDGQFLSDAAVFSVFETDFEFAALKFQHVVPGKQRVVITESDVDQRIIREIDGLPAAERYAEVIGKSVDELSPLVFTQHPLVLSVGEENFVRSIATVGPDLSLNCFCAVDTGFILTIGELLEPIALLERALDKASNYVGDMGVILASDCILRRLEFEHAGSLDAIGKVMAQHRVFGFSTYGEQFNAYHVNQTFTGIALGGGP